MMHRRPAEVNVGRIHSRLSIFWIQFTIIIVLSVALTIALPGIPAGKIESWYFFHSSVFQGFSALAGICLVATFFFYERLEMHLESLKQTCVQAARRLRRGGMGLFDEGTMLGLLQDTKRKLKQLESAELRKIKDEWNLLYGPYVWVFESLEEIAHAEEKRSVLSGFIREYFVPMFAPILWSLFSLSFADLFWGNSYALAFSIYFGTLLTVLMIARLIFGTIWGAWNEILSKGPNPSDFIFNSLEILSLSGDSIESMVENDVESENDL
jgi:hypothetical protein